MYPVTHRCITPNSTDVGIGAHHAGASSASQFQKPCEEALPRVAIFQAFWRLHSSTVYSARTLAAAGYCVDLFLFEVDTSITMSELNGVERVIVHRLEAEENSLRRAMRTFWNCI